MSDDWEPLPFIYINKRPDGWYIKIWKLRIFPKVKGHTL